LLCYRCGSHVPDSAERCNTCGQRQVGTARMPTTTGIRRRLSPALLAGAPYRVGDRMAERYVVKDAIGIGPLGYVFRAGDEQQGIDVAVKMIHPRFVQTAEEREAFARTIEPARRFMQPSLARLHDLGVDQGWPYLTYSFLDGLTLRRMIDSRLAKGQTFTLEEVEPFLGQLAAALEAAHPLGAHADLKPENVVILPDMLRVVDWGLARGLPRLPFVQAQKQKSAHRYLAPEVVAGAEPDPRADLYALGVLVGEMLTGLTPDEDIPELRLTAPELPEAVEGFYRKALNERPEARFRSVRELYEEFVALLAPASQSAAVPGGGPLVEAGPSEAAEALVERLEPMPDAPAPGETPAAASVPAPSAEPIAAAALPRFEGHGAEAPRHTREVVALEPPEWTGTSAPASEAPPPRSGSNRWRSLKLWDAQTDGRERAPATAGSAPPSGPAVAAEATGPELPLNTQPALALLGSAVPPPTGALDPSEDEAERAVAGLTEVEDAAEVVDVADGDEPLLAEALGVDLLVDGDEPVPERARSAEQASGPEAVPETPRVVPVPEEPAQQTARPPPASSVREVPRLVPDSQPWAAEPKPAPYRRETRETPGVHPRPAPAVAPAASLPEPPAVAARSVLPPPPTIPPMLSTVPRLSTVEPVAASISAAPTPLTVVPEPSPTRQEKVVAPPPPLEALTPVAVVPARGAGSWSPAELLAQVIAEVRAEERRAGLPQGTTWEPVPLDATQPISTDEVAARLAAETHGPATLSVAAAADEVDLPALSHEAGRAGMRMALLVAGGLIIGMLGGWSLGKFFTKPPRPHAERISEAKPGQAPAPKN
jgi:serine/threonine protein kinase